MFYRFVGSILLALCAGAVCLGAVPSQIFNESGHARKNDWFYPDDETRRVSSVGDVITPHIAWLKPSEGGAVRVLAIAHKLMGRWPVELSQRFDLQIKVVYTHAPQQLGATENPGFIAQGERDTEARILQAMNDPLDVIVSEVPLPVLGSRIQERLEELLEKGVGYVGPTDGLDLGGRRLAVSKQIELINSAVPLAGLRLLGNKFPSANKASGSVVKLWKAKEGLGRVADVWSYPRDTAKPDPDRLQYDWLPSMEQEAWFSMVGRTIFWVAGRLPAKSAIPIDWPTEPIERASMPYSLSLNNSQSKLSVRVWDEDGRIQHKGHSPTISTLPAGRYFVGIGSLSGGNAKDWVLGTILVQAPVEIIAVDLDDRYKTLDETITARVSLSAPPEEGSQLHMEVLDNFGRCIAQSTINASQQASFEASLKESLHLYNYVNVQLLSSERQVIAEKRMSFYISQPIGPFDDLTGLVWGPNSFNPRVRCYLRRYTELGGTLSLAANGSTDTTRIEAAAISNLHAKIWLMSVRHPKVSEEGVRSPCLTSPGYKNSLKKNLVGQAKVFKHFSPLVYSLGDDQQYLSPAQDACWSPSCRKSLANWVKNKYGNIRKVNQAWSTSYTSFDQVEPIKRAEAIEAACQQNPPNYGPLCHWVDHQLWTDTMFADWHKEMGEAIHAEDPGRPVGYGGTIEYQRPGSGFDFWQLTQKQGFAFQYPNPMAHDIFKSAYKSGTFRGIWYGGYGIYNLWPYYDQDFMPWWAVFRGVNLHGLFHGGVVKSELGLSITAPDLGPSTGFAKIRRNLRELKAGPAKLFMNADRITDGVALVYSPESIHATAALKGLPKAPEWDEGLQTAADRLLYMQSWEAMSSLLGDMGLSFDVIPSSHLEGDRFLSRNFRVLVLPMNVHINPRQAQTITRFVRSGGILIADAFPGLFDGQCDANQEGVLAECLGVRFPGGIPGPTLRQQEAHLKDGSELGTVVAEAGIIPTAAVQLGQTADATPVFLVNSFGKGQAILFNIMIRDYQIWRTMSTELPFRQTVARLLSESGITPAIRIDVTNRDKTVSPLQASEIHRFRLGNTEYVGLLRHAKLRPDESVYMADQRPKAVWITFDRKAHVYDVRHRVYRGLTNKINDMIYPARAEVYALLDYEVVDLDVRCQWTAGAIVLSAGIIPGGSGIIPDTHVFRVEFTDPDNRVRPELAQNIVAPKGQFTKRFFMGYNTAPQGWRVKVRDVASGTVRECVLSGSDGK